MQRGKPTSGTYWNLPESTGPSVVIAFGGYAAPEQVGFVASSELVEAKG